MDLTDATWRKATRSSEKGDDCVEVANAPGTVAIRDSKNPDGPKLLIPRPAYTNFTTAIKNL
ncbi:DUF397 domain-containing protein [Actinomadura atramentaria]|uniref:DUF397 domain-containing protein n=1 Tax=Actinomadura atramentaria TaxID=1990 RepID=UPI000369A560|nr:DUF397 domain-containing protein [Actinomadura atramentaria]